MSLLSNWHSKQNTICSNYYEFHLPYARHYKPRLAFFFTQFSFWLRFILQTIYVLKMEILHSLSSKSAAYKQERLQIERSIWWRTSGRSSTYGEKNISDFLCRKMVIFSCEFVIFHPSMKQNKIRWKWLLHRGFSKIFFLDHFSPSFLD